MPEHDLPPKNVDWRLTTFEGARREQLRRWAQLPLERILLAIEDMGDLARLLSAARADEARGPRRDAGVRAPVTSPLSAGDGECGESRDDGGAAG